METLPGTWREPHRDTAFPRDEAFRLWAEAAVPVLERVASRYGGYITYKGFAEELFEATGVRTGQQLNYWVGDVLASVISACAERGLPELSSLVVHMPETGWSGPVSMPCLSGRAGHASRIRTGWSSPRRRSG